MSKITFPLKPRMKAAAVGDLQDALQLLLDSNVLLADDKVARRELSAALLRERAKLTYGRATSQLVSALQQKRRLRVTGTVNKATADALNRLLEEVGGERREKQIEFTVTGTVRFADGTSAGGITVTAFDRDLRNEQVLRRVETDRQGTYEISYSARQFRKAEKDTADLVLKAFAADGSLLATSDVLFNAPPDATVDLTIPIEAIRPSSLFERIGDALKRLLEAVKVEELEEDKEHQDVSFLSGETGFSTNDVARFVLAHRLAQRELPAEFWFVLLGGSFYEFNGQQSLQEQLSAINASFSSLDEGAVRRALDRGLNQREIRAEFQEKTAGWIEAFLRFIASQSVGATTEPGFIKSALDDAQITDPEKQITFARLFSEHQGFTRELLEALRNETAFTTAEVSELRTSFQLANLTQGDFSVVKMLKQEFGIRQAEQVRTLARQSTDEWIALVEAKHAAGVIKIPIEIGATRGDANMSPAKVYGKTLERQFREAFPTSALAGGLQRALRNGGAHGLQQAEILSRFLDRHEKFELLNTRVDEFFKEGVRSDFRMIAQDDEFRREVKAVQRVFKLAPTFEATDVLLADDLHSAQKIYRLGKSEFVRRYSTQPGFTEETARLAWDRAADTHAAVLTVVTDLKSLDAEALPAVLQNNNQALSEFPNWNNLFQAGDLCECEHCRSVLSPAAYFADLLMFLKDRQAKTAGQSVKDILLKRRPDLGFIELNCDNALVPLPYVDVVCEVLEKVVDATGENDLELTGFTAVPADPLAAKTAVAKAFQDALADPASADKQRIELGDDFSLSQIHPSDPDGWVVHGDNATYLLKKKTTANFFAEILCNTKASAAELRAYPQYVNPKAYEKLRAAKYPLSLPFDLFAEEVRAAFQKTNLQRWDLMRTLRGSAAPNNPTDGEIAAEYFGISTDASATFDEKRLIFVPDATISGQQDIWGVGGANWLTTVGNVKNFLQKTGLEYNDLLVLLDLKFINPTGDIRIQHLDASCDTDKKIIKVLDHIKLDRIHRFLRLWRKLKDWKLWELDLVLRHPRVGKGALDEPFVIALFYFSQLRQRLGAKVTVEQTCALFGDLNTQTRFTKLHEKRADALYQNLFLNKRLFKPLDPAFQLDPGTGILPVGQTITAHHPVFLAVLGIREADLVLVKGLTKASNGSPYITDDLTLANVSFLWRHAWLAKQLKFKVADWKIVLEIFQQDVAEFAGPQAAHEFCEKIDLLKAAGFSADELNWILAADRLAKAATKESDAARFLATLRKELQEIKTEADPTQYDFLSASPPTDVASLTALLTSLLEKMNWADGPAQLFLATLRDEVNLSRQVVGLPAGFDFSPAIKSTIRIRYDEPTKTLHFTGLMTAAQLATLKLVTALPAYQDAIEELFNEPRLALKFFDPVFTAPLARLPKEVDFKTLSDADLARRISYDDEQRLLRCAGVLSKTDQAALEALSKDVAYRNAVKSLATQPAAIVPPNDRIWLLEADLKFPLRDLKAPANDHLAENLVTAVKKALAYLPKTLSERAVVQQSSAQLGLSEALTRRLLAHYSVLPDPLLVHLTGPFVATTGVVDYATLKLTFDGWFWASRAAAILKGWKITLAQLEDMSALPAGAKLLDLAALPLDDTKPVASLENFLRTSRLLRVREDFTETEITLLEVLKKLSTGGYATAAAFAADVELLNEAWLASDVEALVASLNLTYPADYLLAESWERLRRAFYFLTNLNAKATTASSFAAAAMGPTHAKTIKELLRAKFGEVTWLTLCGEIQDVLRDRKRDCLSAYLLTLPKPADAPSGKWENTNDLYAYYLIDVEMCSCMQTSRLVQGSGSVQLLVQRCFMGLEPEIEVRADGPSGDSAWRWWKWMRKYRVWEANRKIFLWPENWIEPQLKKDRSSFFKALEDELMQNEVDPFTVETGYGKYLEKLDGVAQLDIAALFQEDDGDNTFVHVFGRTTKVTPPEHYYRRYDYRQWTPWEKIELDIQGDYLVPVVVANRLFLFWPVFSEVPDEKSNDMEGRKVPNQGDKVPKDSKAQKKLQLKMAVSEYRQGKWMPTKVSTDFNASAPYATDIIRSRYVFYPVDRSDVDGRFGIRYDGYSVSVLTPTSGHAYLNGAFEISGCKGVPVRVNDLPGYFHPAQRPQADSTGKLTSFLKWEELPARGDVPWNDFTLEDFFDTSTPIAATQILTETPGLFGMTSAWHLSYLDKLFLNGSQLLTNRDVRIPVGSWLPYFYNDRRRTFFVLPVVESREERYGTVDLPKYAGAVRYYYPDIKKFVRQLEAFYEGQIQAFLDGYTPPAVGTAGRKLLDAVHQQAFPAEEVLPPYRDEHVKRLMKRMFMRFYHQKIAQLAFDLLLRRQFHFKNFYHPFACDFIKLVHNPLKGIPALMSRETQLKDTGFDFDLVYRPTSAVVKLPPQYPSLKDCYPKEVVDFTPDGAYSPYNWELFFHIPLLIANLLSTNQRFEEARQWYHYIFNPLGVEGPVPGGSPMSKYWITKPFFETADKQYIQQRIENILRMLAGDTTVPGYSTQLKKDLEDQVFDWRTNPFEPHRIANYRTVAYQKTVVMKYLDNLIAWGDYLFRQDSMESINEATQLYILAAEILGPRPKKLPPRSRPRLESFNELEFEFDKFSNALVEVENLVPVLPGNGPDGEDPAPLPMLYFCIPQNEKLLSYWDTVADRLYKIRHCMNIEGEVRQLALFEPPIDPAALVKAVAGGLDIASALAELNAPPPIYHFNVMLQKANELCNDVKVLGNALLAALEKKDAEELSRLRQEHEIKLVEAVKLVRDLQIQEANDQLEGLRRSRQTVEERRNFYRDVEKVSGWEAASMITHGLGIVSEIVATVLNATAGVAHLVPSFKVGAAGFGGSPYVVIEYGGANVGKSAFNWATFFGGLGGTLHAGANLMATQASNERRWDDWKLQERLADKELASLDKSIDVATVRVSIATQERDNQVDQIKYAHETADFMKSKYTNMELYQWHVAQISGTYFQSYKLAYDLAKRAERCFRFELGLQDSSYINFGYWDSLKKGLLAGEKLQYDLRRLEAAYLEQNRREFELTKHISLLFVDPLALVQLRETGRCFFRLPEEIFDLDFPGHYFRRIKSVSISLPCVAGPYTTIACTLRLLKNSIRITTGGGNGYARNTDSEGLPADDMRFVENNVPVKAIAASNAQNDSGVFELNFRDERYLPFEGAGAVSEWSLELFNDKSPDFGKPLWQYDYSKIKDAILHMKYTSREDAGPFKNGAITNLRDYFSQDGATPSWRMFSLREESASQWQRFLRPANPADGNIFELVLSTRLFRMLDEKKSLKVNSIGLMARCTGPASTGSYDITLTADAEPPITTTLAPPGQPGGLHSGQKDALGLSVSTSPPSKWQLKMTRAGGSNLQEDPATKQVEVEDVLLVVGYQWE